MRVQKKRSRSALKAGAKSKIALVCAGGGVTGALYEIGCLKALDESVDLDLTRLDLYVGVSGGAFVSSLLASGFTPGEMYREITTGGAAPFGVPGASLFRLGVAEYARRALRLPGAALKAVQTLFSGDASSSRDMLLPFLEAIPPGLLDNSGVEEYLRKLFARFGKTNRFASLRSHLRIVAVDLDRGETVAFGGPKQRAVTISEAVQASTALPGLYRPVRLKGKDYVDGGVTKTAHINLAIRGGADLVICINPLVPILNGSAHSALGPLSSHGVDTVLGQVLRIFIHGRFEYGLDRYRNEHPEVDILILQPTRDDLTMFRYDIMRYSARKALARHGHSSTLESLSVRRGKIEKTLARHGVRLKRSSGRGASRQRPAEEHQAQTSQVLAASLDALDRSLCATR